MPFSAAWTQDGVSLSEQTPKVTVLGLGDVEHPLIDDDVGVLGEARQGPSIVHLPLAEMEFDARSPTREVLNDYPTGSGTGVESILAAPAAGSIFRLRLMRIEMDDRPKLTGRRWLQFHLRTLLIVMLVVTAYFAGRMPLLRELEATKQKMAAVQKKAEEAMVQSLVAREQTELQRLVAP